MIDWKAVADELGDEIAERLDKLVESGREDLKAYGKDIAKGLIIAVRTGRQDLRDELLEQSEMLAEVHRIELNREAKEMLDSALKVGMRIGSAALAAL